MTNFLSGFRKLYEKDWYKEHTFKRGDGTERVQWYSFWMIQAVHIEIGNHYRSSRNMYLIDEQYSLLIRNWMDKENEEGFDKAFYLIKHSVSQKGTQIVSVKFWRLLKELHEHKELKIWKNRANEAFYQKNATWHLETNKTWKL